MADIDLTSPGSTTTIDGVIITYGDPIGSGTGLYDPFLGINDNDGDEEGFNTDASGVLDTDQSKTSSLTFNQIPVKIIDGVEYFEFRLDLNQTNADTNISLTSLKLYYSSASATGADYISATNELDSDFTKVFDLDSGGDTRLLLDAHSSGSGNDDYVFFVPVSSFAGADFATDFITLYADFGSPGTDYAANDGFEEFNTEKVSTINGVKFNDTDGDGVKDAGEAGLAGWTIFIDTDKDGVLDADERSTVTDANGAFQFAGVGTSLESVQIDEVLQAGWVQTTGDFETVDVSSAGNYSVQIGNFLPNPALNITKDASVPGGTANAAGEVISYTISVANTGNVALTGVTVTDPFVSNLAPVLSGGFNSGDIDHDSVLDTTETWHYTATHTVTQAEIDAGGTIDNTATADSDQTGPDTDPASIPVEQNPALNITKDASVPGGTADAAGELINYTISVANTGNMTLSGVTVTDPFADVGSIVRGADTVGDNDALLEVGETWSYTAAHTVTQAELDSNGGGDGALENTATADSTQTGPDTDDASVPVEQRPSLNIVKDASVPGGTADTAGELISYTISVANTGNTTLTGVTVTDPFADVGSIVRGADVVGDNDALLEVGETWGYTAAHTVTQAEIDSNGGGDGLLQNTATADSTETGPDTDDANVPVEQRPGMNITKDASVPGGTADTAGELISYTITVANTGNTTLTGVSVTDPFADVGSIVRGADVVGDNDALLEVGETWGYTAAHTVTQAEIDSNGGGDGALENIATAHSDQTSDDDDDASVPVSSNPALNITKDASVPGGTANAAGELISYTITVANTGNTTLTGVTVTDPFADVGSIVRGADVSGDNDALLEVGETWGYTAAHTVTQAEIDSNGGGDGALENTATADSNETGPDTDDASVPVCRNPALNITKDASVPGGTANAAGELISYTITVANTGNTTLTGVTVTDPFADVGSIVRGADVSGDNDALLEVGETWGYTAAHTVTQAEIDSNGGGDGALENTATADSTETGPDTDDASVPVDRSPSLNITKDASVPGGTADAAGELISYTITVANTGNTTLTGVTVTDPFADVGSIVRGADVSGDNDALLEVGETWGYTAAHTVTQAELDSNGGGDGLLQNTATADSNETGPDTDDANVPVAQRASIDIEKYVSIDGGLTWDDADNPQGPVATSSADIQFKFVVSNTGNVTLTNATVTDSVFDLNGADPGTAMSLGTLDVGETNTFYYDASWTVGQHVNDATATGTYSGGPVSDHDLAYYFGLIDCVGVRTPGFWQSPNGLTFWDGTIGNETKSGPEFADGELLAYNNSITDGPDPGTSNLQERYILLGDDDGDGVTDAGEDTLKISLDLALKIIDASQKTQQDARWVLARDAVAAWLNFEAGNDDGSPLDLNSPAHKMDLAIDWLQQYADSNHDGVLDFNGPAIKQNSAAWQGSGAGLHTALDEYNNFGTINGVAYACDADDHLFVDALARYHEDVLA
jgi:uncharacterized repeat protein (TIGR01451 family)